MHFDLVANISSNPNPKLIWLRGTDRIELSGVTLANGISKAANFLLDSWEVNPGHEVKFAIDSHWQSVVWLNAVLTIGAQVVTEGDTPFAIASPSRIAEVSTADEIGQLSNHPFGLGSLSEDPFVTDLATEVRAHGDLFRRPVHGNGRAISDSMQDFDYAVLMSEAKKTAADRTATNLFVSGPPQSAKDLLTYAMLPFATTGALIISAELPTPDLLVRESAQLVEK